MDKQQLYGNVALETTATNFSFHIGLLKIYKMNFFLH